MKFLILLSVVAWCVSARPDSYTDRYDGIDLQEILNNKRLLVPYIQCILEKGKCSPEGKELRSHIRDALENDCGKCTETQRRGARTVIKHLVNHEDAYWQQLVAKYDPSKKYEAKYQKSLKDF